MSPPLTILRSDYLQILDRLITQEIIESLDDQKITRATRFCAAKLLQIFERLTNWKKEAYKKLKDCWFWIPIIKTKPKSDERQQVLEIEAKAAPFRSLHDELQGEHCKDVIRNALALLKSFAEEGVPLLSCSHNPHDPQSRTYWYKVNLEWLDRLKASLGAKSDLPTLQSEIPTLESEKPPIISEINSKTFQETLSDREQFEAQTEPSGESSLDPNEDNPSATPLAKLIKKSGALYPDGDWLNDCGFLHEDFVRTQALLWCKGDTSKSKAFASMAIEDVMSCVCSCYAKNPGKLAIDWQAYCTKNHRYLETVRLRLNAGASVSESEQQTILSKLPALAQGFSVAVPALPSRSLPPAKRPDSFRDLLRQAKNLVREEDHE